MQIEWAGDSVKAILKQASMAGLELAAEHLLQVSSSKAPLEEGDLARSGEVTKDEASAQVAVVYDRPYAVRQHEEMNWRHDAGKQAKYLEEPMHTEQDTMLALIAGAVTDGLES